MWKISQVLRFQLVPWNWKINYTDRCPWLHHRDLLQKNRHYKSITNKNVQTFKNILEERKTHFIVHLHFISNVWDYQAVFCLQCYFKIKNIKGLFFRKVNNIQNINIYKNRQSIHFGILTHTRSPSCRPLKIYSDIFLSLETFSQ